MGGIGAGLILVQGQVHSCGQEHKWNVIAVEALTSNEVKGEWFLAN